MTFPQGSAIILGANFLAPNELGICASRWCLLHKTLPLKSLIPCKIGGSVYRALQSDTETSANSQSEQDPSLEINSVDTPQLHPAIARAPVALPQGPSLPRTDVAHGTGSTASIICAPAIKQQVTNTVSASTRVPRQSKGCPRTRADVPASLETRFDPMRGKLNTHGAKTASNTNTDPEFAYQVFPTAHYNLKTGTTVIKIRIEHQNSTNMIYKDNFNTYEICPNIIQPGVIVERTLTSGLLTTQITNLNGHPVVINRDIPITTAALCDSDMQIKTVKWLDDNMEPTNHPEIENIILMLDSFNEVTERACVGIQPESEDPDLLDQKLDYDPTEIKDQKVIYDEDRVQKLLELLRIDEWELNDTQKQQAIDVIRRKQQSLDISGNLYRAPT